MQKKNVLSRYFEKKKIKYEIVEQSKKKERI